MIQAHNLSKRYGDKLVVTDLSFTVRPGVVTGFLGPNGAGESTTMRLIVGLDAPTSGVVTVAGRHYADFAAPLREVGLLLEARSVHPGRSACSHLLALAHTHGIGRNRVDQLIELVGLSSVAHRRAGRLSLGMSQRLGLAAALLADPSILVLDEPAAEHQGHGRPIPAHQRWQLHHHHPPGPTHPRALDRFRPPLRVHRRNTPRRRAAPPPSRLVKTTDRRSPPRNPQSHAAPTLAIAGNAPRRRPESAFLAPRYFEPLRSEFPFARKGGVVNRPDS